MIMNQHARTVASVTRAGLMMRYLAMQCGPMDTQADQTGLKALTATQKAQAVRDAGLDFGQWPLEAQESDPAGFDAADQTAATLLDNAIKVLEVVTEALAGRGVTGDWNSVVNKLNASGMSITGFEI